MRSPLRGRCVRGLWQIRVASPAGLSDAIVDPRDRVLVSGYVSPSLDLAESTPSPSLGPCSRALQLDVTAVTTAPAAAKHSPLPASRFPSSSSGNPTLSSSGLSRTIMTRSLAPRQLFASVLISLCLVACLVNRSGALLTADEIDACLEIAQAIPYLATRSNGPWVRGTLEQICNPAEPVSLGDIQCDSNGRPNTLYLTTDNLVGSFPDAISRLSSLVAIYIGTDPALTGTLPAAWSNLTSLQTLFITAAQGQIPASWSQMASLNTLTIQFLNSAPPTLQLPDWVSNSSTFRSLSLTTARFDPFPAKVASSTTLTALDLHNIALTGSLPAALLVNEALMFLSISGLSDYSTGSGLVLPPDFSGMKSLTSLVLSTLGFSGSIAVFPKNMAILSIVDMPNLGGTIPSAIMDGPLTRLFLANLPGLKGNLPSSTNPAASVLALFQLLNVGLDGTVPANFFDLATLATVSMINSTSLQGSLPELSAASCLKLTTLTISGSPLLTGSIPNSLFTCPRLFKVILDNNGFTGSLPAMLGNKTYNKYLYYLSISGNPTSGSIPSITMQRAMLSTLMLNDAGLTGTIPLSLVNSSRLSSLQLAGNNFDLCANANTTSQESLSTLLAAMTGTCDITPTCVSYDCPDVWPSNCIPNVATNNTCPPPTAPVAIPVADPFADPISPFASPASPIAPTAPLASPIATPVQVLPSPPVAESPLWTAPTPGTPNTFATPSGEASAATFSVALFGLALAAALAM